MTGWADFVRELAPGTKDTEPLEASHLPGTLDELATYQRWAR